MPRTVTHPEFEVPPEQAIAMLLIEGEGDERSVHTFRELVSKGPGGRLGRMLIGADWDYEMVVEAIKEYGVEEAGPGASSMGHGLILTDETGPLFIATKRSTTDDPSET